MMFPPEGPGELELAYAGLGKRIISTHSEIVALLEEEFPKPKLLKEGWMFFKSTGGSRRCKLSIIPTDNEGYSTRLLKSVSNNGKDIVFVVPLQEQLSTEALPFDSPEFAKMPQSCCISCGSEMPLQRFAQSVSYHTQLVSSHLTQAHVVTADRPHPEEEEIVRDECDSAVSGAPPAEHDISQTRAAGPARPPSYSARTG
ncbi:uncharacterized protein LOC119015873 [Acanthopagrus latus]|uniref:uncharacterized protein LOC119015873 n=1 Tax=Acanthopagrus latus TaxID=8177 RepID=UPI00187C84E3|nr:uncharacterized protein LOC119015873 [Acanthopagrus latus]XP_036947820.1 uncharacterized protein LOC119015873 [Acanthopagrus latus]XP_036947821.1 uncharacterized protein LOC119015873 [Acanthopagrus latus]